MASSFLGVAGDSDDDGAASPASPAVVSPASCPASPPDASFAASPASPPNAGFAANAGFAVFPRRCPECDERMCCMRCDDNPGVGVCDLGGCGSPVNLAVGQRVCMQCTDDAQCRRECVDAVHGTHLIECSMREALRVLIQISSSLRNESTAGRPIRHRPAWRRDAWDAAIGLFALEEVVVHME